MQSPTSLLFAQRLEEKKSVDFGKCAEEDINLAEADLLEEDPYDWGLNGQPKGKPVQYIPGVGLVVIGGKNHLA